MIEQQIMSNQSAAVDVTSVPVQIDDLNLYGVQVVFSGGASDLAGVLTLEASNDNVTYITIQGSAQTVSASQNHFWNVEDAAYRWFRAVWTYTSGTGNITMIVVIKQPTNRF